MAIFVLEQDNGIHHNVIMVYVIFRLWVMIMNNIQMDILNLDKFQLLKSMIIHKIYIMMQLHHPMNLGII